MADGACYMLFVSSILSLATSYGGRVLALTPGQLRELVGLPPETYRHWRKALPPLRRGSSRRATYTIGDLLAVSVVTSVVRSMGVKVGHMAPISDQLFRLCNGTPWHAMSQSHFVIDLTSRTVTLEMKAASPAENPAIVVPCGMIIEGLRRQLLPEEQQAQAHLRFPPTPLSRRYDKERTKKTKVRVA